MIRSRRAFLSTSAAFTAAACATPIEQTAPSAPLIPGAPLKISADRTLVAQLCNIDRNTPQILLDFAAIQHTASIQLSAPFA